MNRTASAAGVVQAGTTATQIRQSDYAHQAYLLLRWGFTALPVIAGFDKFFHLLTNWESYLAPAVTNLIAKVGVSNHIFMQAVGVIEIVAGLVVAFKPKFGAYLVAAWLAGIIVNLLVLPGYYDVALRDFGLFLGAIALARLSQHFNP